MRTAPLSVKQKKRPGTMFRGALSYSSEILSAVSRVGPVPGCRLLTGSYSVTLKPATSFMLVGKSW